MVICEKIYIKKFSGRTTKDAYLDACKWVSTNFIAVNNCEHILYKIEKEQRNEVKLIIYVAEEENEILKQNCEVCKEMNKHFYLKENAYMCYTCKINPYRERMKEKLKKIAESIKGRLI
jgi:hypothetical protein